MDVRHLAEDDVAEAARVFKVALGSPPPKRPERYGRYWDVPTSLGAWDDRGRLVGVAARFATRMTAVGGAELPCSAVPSVGVRPDAHGRGAGRALLEQQVHEAVDHGDAVLALNSSEVAIYGRYGYGPTSAWWSVETDPRTLGWRRDAPRAEAGSVEEVDVATAHELLPDLHERCMGRWGGELARHAGWWSAALTTDDGSAPATTAVHRAGDGTVDAAVRFGVEQAFDGIGFANKVEVHDAFGLDRRAEAVLVRWLLERRLVGTWGMERFDPRSVVPWMLEDPRRLVTKAAQDAVWVRVLDVPRVVAARTTQAVDVAPVAVEVRDPLVAGCAGTWLVGAADGRLTCAATDHEPEVVVGVDLLASLLWGYATPVDLAAAGRIRTVDTAPVGRLQRLLAVTEPSWCSTGF